MNAEKYKETTDDMATAKLVSLLHAQPKVKAPADFMAQLQMRMAVQSQNAEASQDARLKSLLQAVPAVSAPPDFAFRVRARLAQAKSEQVTQSPLAWIESWFANSFSFGQAASAIAAIALIAVFTTMQFRNTNTSPVESAGTNIAQMTSTTVANVPASVVAVPSAVNAPHPVRHSFGPVKATAVSTMKVESAIARTASRTSVEPTMYSARTKQEVYLGRDNHAYGQQLAKVVAAKNAETMIAAF